MRYLSFALLFVFSFSFSQSKIVLDSKGRKILDKTILFKIKPEYKDKCTAENINLPSLKIALNTISAIKVERKFKHLANQKLTQKEIEKGFVDLSLMYQLKYSNNIEIEKAISILLNSKVIAFADPYFFDELLYEPNDPYAIIGANLQDNYLTKIRAYEAWDIEKGDTTVSIASVDTGIRFNHEDLKNMVYINWAEYPENGIDDDENGYIDDYRGWDVTRDENDPEFEHWHGPFVAGCSSAEPDNNKGIVGTGFNCRITPVKVYNWEQVNGTWQFTAFDGYGGIVYAAESGAKVMNISWGSAGTFSNSAQEIINYAAINKDITIIAAAGNTAPRQNYYPASYNNVLSVTGTTWQDEYIPAITSSYFIDISSPYHVFSTDWFADTLYSTVIGGTSFSAPLAAGAAGLVRSKFPNWNALQTMEQIRVTVDNIDTIGTNENYYGEFGVGRLNMYKALTDTFKTSVRALNTNQIKTLVSNDTSKASYVFQNFLYPVTNLKVTLRVSSNAITLIDSVFIIGSLGTLDTISNFEIPFKWLVNYNAVSNDLILFRLIFEGDNYTDYQNIVFRISPDFINVSKNNITTTVTSRGRIGYNDVARTEGRGFIYKTQDLLWDMGLLIATNDTSVASTVRSTSSNSNEFISTKNVFENLNSKISLADYNSRFIDSLTVNRINVDIKQNTYFWNNIGHRKYFVTEYVVKNRTNQPINNFYIGHFADWDIQNAMRNKAKSDTINKLGFVFLADTASGIGNRFFAGIKQLTHRNKSRYYAIDNDPSIAGNPFGNWDEFTDEEKYQALSSTTPRLDAGFDNAVGRDVSHVVGNGPFVLGVSDSLIVAYAIFVGDSIQDIYTTATNAQYMYDQATAPMPVLADINACYGQNIVLSPTGANRFKFYTSPTSTTPIDSGTVYRINKITASRVIYITNADSSYESRRLRVNITVKPSKTEIFANTDLFQIGIDSHIDFVSMGPKASSYLWDFGDGQFSTDSATQHTFTTPNLLTVYLSGIYNDFSCTVKDSIEILVVDPNGVKNQNNMNSIYIRPNISQNDINVYVTKKSNLIVSDILGKEHKQINLLNGINTVSITDLPKGLYLFRIEEQVLKVLKE